MSDQPHALDDVNSVEETIAFLKLTKYELAQLVRLGKIGSIKQGRKRTFPREAIQAYVENNQILPTPPNPHGLTDASLRRVRAGKGLSA